MCLTCDLDRLRCWVCSQWEADNLDVAHLMVECLPVVGRWCLSTREHRSGRTRLPSSVWRRGRSTWRTLSSWDATSTRCGSIPESNRIIIIRYSPILPNIFHSHICTWILYCRMCGFSDASSSYSWMILKSNEEQALLLPLSGHLRGWRATGVSVWSSAVTDQCSVISPSQIRSKWDLLPRELRRTTPPAPAMSSEITHKDRSANESCIFLYNSVRHIIQKLSGKGATISKY